MIDSKNKKALLSIRTFTLVTFFVSIACTIKWSNVGQVSVWQWYLTSVASFLLSMVALWAKKISSLVSGLIYLLSVGFVLFAMTWSNIESSNIGLHYDFFQNYKLAALIYAATIYPAWIGYLSVSVCGLLPVALYFVLSENFGHGITILEPWLTVFYSVIASILIMYRRRALELEQKLIEMAAQKKSIDRFANAMLAVRDLSNSPLQTLIGTTAMLNEEVVPRGEIARLNRNAVNRLCELSQILATHEHQVDWSRTKASFDATEVLKRTLESKD